MDRIGQSGGTSVLGSPSIGLLRQDLAAVLEHSEEAVAIGRARKVFSHRQAAFDAVNAHSQADEPPLSFVMEFNAAESKWREAQARLKKMLEDLKKRGPGPKLQQQMERIQRLPRTQQRFVMEVIDTVLAQQDR